MSAHRPEKVRASRATIDDWKRSGQTVNAFCRARQLTRRSVLMGDPMSGDLFVFRTRRADKLKILAWMAQWM